MYKSVLVTGTDSKITAEYAEALAEAVGLFYLSFTDFICYTGCRGSKEEIRREGADVYAKIAGICVREAATYERSVIAAEAEDVTEAMKKAFEKGSYKIYVETERGGYQWQRFGRYVNEYVRLEGESAVRAAEHTARKLADMI